MSGVGYKNDAPAAVNADSTASTLESDIALLKAIKNLNRAVLAKLSADPATQTTLASMAADIAIMKADLDAIRAILES